jgi:hypothetical protein
LALSLFLDYTIIFIIKIEEQKQEQETETICCLPTSTGDSRPLKTLTEKEIVYETLDNGGCAFIVTVSKSNQELTVHVTNDFEIENSDEDDSEYKKRDSPIFNETFTNLKSMLDGSESDFGTPGASVLFETQKSNEFLFIGTWIGKFIAKSKIVALYNTEKSSEVCYPFAIDAENNIYLLYSSKIEVLKISNNGSFTTYTDGEAHYLNLETHQLETKKTPLEDIYLIKMKNPSEFKVEIIMSERLA